MPLRASCRDGAGRQTSPGATARTEAAEEGAGVVRVVSGRQLVVDSDTPMGGSTEVLGFTSTEVPSFGKTNIHI